MDRLLAKMKQVGYTRFDLGLPGNLIPIAKKDYVTGAIHRYGGAVKEDGSDGFQIYENGGATACFAYFTLAALYDLGRREEADRILFPMLDAFEKRGFEGGGANGMSNDWKTWDGTPWGLEGFLTDNYYAFGRAASGESRPPKGCTPASQACRMNAVAGQFPIHPPSNPPPNHTSATSRSPPPADFEDRLGFDPQLSEGVFHLFGRQLGRDEGEKA